MTRSIEPLRAATRTAGGARNQLTAWPADDRPRVRGRLTSATSGRPSTTACATWCARSTAGRPRQPASPSCSPATTRSPRTARGPPRSCWTPWHGTPAGRPVRPGRGLVKTNAGPVVVLGHSFGGAVTLAADHSRIRGKVAVSPGGLCRPGSHPVSCWRSWPGWCGHALLRAVDCYGPVCSRPGAPRRTGGMDDAGRPARPSGEFRRPRTGGRSHDAGRGRERTPRRVPAPGTTPRRADSGSDADADIVPAPAISSPTSAPPDRRAGCPAGGSVALNKRGSRPIVVDGNRYRWLIRRKPTYSQGLTWSPMASPLSARIWLGAPLSSSDSHHHDRTTG